VTDAPPLEGIDSFIVQLANIEVRQAGSPENAWTNIMSVPKSFDLTKLPGGKVVELGIMQVNAGTYTQVRIEITRATAITDGEEHEASIPDDRLIFIRPFQVKEEVTTSLILDFDGKKSVTSTNQGHYVFRPVVTLLVPKVEKTKFEGAIEIIAGTTWKMTVEGKTLAVDVSKAEVIGEPAVGLEAEVEGALVEGTFLASVIKIRETMEEEFTGAILNITRNAWILDIDGEVWKVDVSEADIEGKPEVGLLAEVKGILIDTNTIKAREIEIKEKPVSGVKSSRAIIAIGT